MSIKTRLTRLEKQQLQSWEAPFFIIDSEEDARRADALREQYRDEIKRDKARGREIFGVDFRCEDGNPLLYRGPHNVRHNQ